MGYKRIGRGYTRAGPMQAVCTSVCLDNYRQAEVRENWYEELGSLLAQTLQKKTGKETENLIS
jgi:hypothetical protein